VRREYGNSSFDHEFRGVADVLDSFESELYFILGDVGDLCYGDD
jgi:hypothetical protein